MARRDALDGSTLRPGDAGLCVPTRAGAHRPEPLRSERIRCGHAQLAGLRNRAGRRRGQAARAADADRAKPAVPFGGNYRLIDFALSNLVNAGYRRIVVLTQYKSHSLDRHIATTWRLSPMLGNYVTPVPAQMRRGPCWFAGSADAIHQNLNLRATSGRTSHRLRRRPHLPHGPAPDGRAARRVRRRVTVAAMRVPIEQADQFGVIETEATARRSPPSARSRRTPSGSPTRRTWSTRRWATTCSAPTSLRDV